MLGAGRGTFPQAEIFIPIINLSDDLPDKIRANIKALNYLIKDTGCHIPRLDRESFGTDMDGIH